MSKRELLSAVSTLAGKEAQSTEFSPFAVPPREAARLVGLSPSTMAKLRMTGTGPLHLKVNGKILYRPVDLAAWLDSHVRRSTSE